MKEEEIVIHVRFANDGAVQEIGQRPAGLSAQAWFGRLWKQAGDRFQVFAGGRGIFRLPRTELEELLAQGEERISAERTEKGAEG
ncbi:hypothetical protein MAMC_00143 [Methylacidimicrobium cyclopophantes]|uniref:Uncharacterized protein n=1 Tax=Methylacidimicrobium cyclopophantes TaxID=1041766 RepID=A0A5E6M5I6_9BACT|nr:hypothetical protein [Methylacidimicrobium cyclopophantes]VVM04605.1 hypothetical protein MAMC_00143 [Methylacidimicrobium cyclopophantes]